MSDYCNALFISIPKKKKKKKEKVGNAAAGFVCNKFRKIDDVLKLHWLLIEEMICTNTAKLAYIGLHDQNFPDHLKVCYKIITQNS